MSGKRCYKCGEVKAVESFSRDKRRKDGREYRCKDCARRYREENREAERERHRRWREENREAKLEYQRRYYEENREAIARYHHRYHEENLEAIAEKDRRYREEYREEIAEDQRRWRESMRDMTREVATRNGEPYNPAEDAHILASDEPVVVIAVDLGRTIGSVNARRRILRKAVSA